VKVQLSRHCAGTGTQQAADQRVRGSAPAEVFSSADLGLLANPEREVVALVALLDAPVAKVMAQPQTQF
jgi:hypothetical protein